MGRVGGESVSQHWIGYFLGEKKTVFSVAC